MEEERGREERRVEWRGWREGREEGGGPSIWCEEGEVRDERGD